MSNQHTLLPVYGTPNEYMTSGYVSLSFGPEDATKLFNKFTFSRNLTTTPVGVVFYRDASYRSASRPEVLDYHADDKGTVVRQQMWQPSQTGDVYRHFRDAAILPPIFFRTTHGIGVDISPLARARPVTALNIFDAMMPVPMGGVVTTHFCLKWPGYNQEFKKQVELKDSIRAPITMSKLVERIVSFVSRFIEEASKWPIDRNSAHWRVGPGFITKDNLYIVGLVHVSAGVWQPILQLNFRNIY